ncbi:hypothetical protein MMC08_005916 [Hypocenomyce scalaris]|nr:hypothetical protein [Hypocenomyce scalaris]
MAVRIPPPADAPATEQTAIKPSSDGKSQPAKEPNNGDVPEDDVPKGMDITPEEPSGNEQAPAAEEGDPHNEAAPEGMDTAPEEPSQEEGWDAPKQQLPTILMDPDVQPLVDHLEKMGIRSTPPATSRFIVAPKGYKLLMETNPEWFYGKRREWRRHEKRKRDLGVPGFNRRRRYGFRPEELIWNGALELKDAKPSNLDNEIHPLLSHDNFDDCPQEIYDQVMPACRLATMFLTKDVCMQYWVTLAHGKREVDAAMTINSRVRQERIREDVPLTATNIAVIRKYLEDLQGKENPIHFTFSRQMPLQNTYAVSSTICDYKLQHRLKAGDTFRRAKIYLHQDYYTAARRLSQLKFPDEAQKLRFNFLLANTLVHELAHVVSMGHVDDEMVGREVFLYDSRVNELGEAWEAKTFGGLCCGVNSRADGSHGVAVCQWPLKHVFTDPEHEHNIWYSVPMSYIENIQQKKTWEQFYELDDEPFHIPKIGAQSAEIVAFTTMKVEEENRILREEMSELLREEADQPAKKKGKTNTGGVRKTDDLAVEVDTAFVAIPPRRGLDAMFRLDPLSPIRARMPKPKGVGQKAREIRRRTGEDRKRKRRD